MRSWRATANGLEGAAVLSNDGVLILDEIKKADPRQVGDIVYTISDEQGKQRANRSGSARPWLDGRASFYQAGRQP